MARRGQVKVAATDKFNRQNHLTAASAVRTMGSGSGTIPSGPTSNGPVRPQTYGGDTASTGVKTRGMHAEHHRLVNPVEHNVTADTQLALAA